MNKTNIILLSSFSVLVLVGGIWYYLDQNKKAKAEEEAFLNENLEANKKTKTQTKSSSSTKASTAITNNTKALTSYDVLSGQANKTIPSGTNMVIVNSATSNTLANQLHENFIYLDNEPYSKDFYNNKIFEIIKNLGSKADLYEVAKKYDTSYNKNTFKAKAGSKYDNLYNRLSNLSNWSDINKNILNKPLIRK
mgnify:CR=1 FL=1